MATNVSKAPATADKQRLMAEGVMEDHPVEIFLFNSTGWITFVWLVIRLWLGWQWLQAGWEKINDPKWMDGTEITGYWNAAISSYGQPHSNVAFGWYVNFLQTLVNNQSQTWMAPLIAYAETLGGIALILGLFTGITAFLLAFLNFNYMLAGSAGVNPLDFTLALVLVMAWKNAGWWGLDRWVLPALGTPWHHGKAFAKTPEPSTTQQTGTRPT